MIVECVIVSGVNFIMNVASNYKFLYNKFFFDYTVLYLRYIADKEYKNKKMFSEKLEQFKEMLKYETVVEFLGILNTNWKDSMYYYKYTFIEYMSLYINYVFSFYLYIEKKYPLPTFFVSQTSITAFEYMLREGISIEELNDN